MSKTFLIILCLFCLLGAYDAQAAVNIAVIAPKSGDFSDAAQNMVKGARAAVAEINEQGGLLGKRVNLVEIEDPCEDSFNVSMAQMMAVNKSIDDKFSMVIGPYCKNEFAKVAQIYAKAQILQIIPQSVSQENLRSKYAGLFELCGKSSEQVNHFFDYYRLTFPNQNVAIAYDSLSPENTELATAVQQKFAQNNLANRLTTYAFANYGKDYSLMAKEILLNNQVIYVLAEPKEITKLTREIRREKQDAIVFADRYRIAQNYFEEVGSSHHNLYFMALESLKDNPQFAETLVKLRLQGEEPKGLGVYGYLGVNFWKDLVLKAKSFNYNKVTAQAASAELPWGNVKFQIGIPDKSAPYGVYRFLDGEYTQVH